MATRPEPQLATVHRLRPRTACAPEARGGPRPLARVADNVIDLSRARRRRRRIHFFEFPPGGSAA